MLGSVANLDLFGRLRRERTEAQTPLGRIGDPEQAGVARALFLHVAVEGGDILVQLAIGHERAVAAELDRHGGT